MQLPIRKRIRLENYDYCAPGFYFVTICTKDKQKWLCDIVGTVVLDGPQVQYTNYGRIAAKYLDDMSDFYDDIKIDKYVIMPNHIHLLIHILSKSDRPSGTTIPTQAKVGRFVGSFKRLTNRKYGFNIWQSRSHDHVVRNERDYLRIWQYIDNIPARWAEDCFYVE